MELADQLIDTWTIHDRINRYVLTAVPDEALGGKLTGGKGRAVGELFAHMHNVRLMWLKAAAPELLAGLEKIEKESAGDRAVLDRSLAASGVAVETLLRQALADGRVKGFKPHPAAFVGYLISHESHHRGEIEVTLTQAGHKLDQKASYGLWEWGLRGIHFGASRDGASPIEPEFAALPHTICGILGNMDRLTIYLPSELHQALKEMAHQTVRSQSSLIREATEIVVAGRVRPRPTTIGIVSDGTVSSEDVEDCLERHRVLD